MLFRDKSDPVGEIHADENLENFLVIMAAKWDEQTPVIRWWQFWKRIKFTKVTNFLIKALDDLISYVDQMNLTGPDKKATVLRVTELLYDHVIQTAMPFWLRPFSKMIKQYIIMELVSTSIDWIVEKYTNGNWRKQDAEELAAQWVSMKAQILGVPGGHRP